MKHTLRLKSMTKVPRISNFDLVHRSLPGETIQGLFEIWEAMVTAWTQPVVLRITMRHQCRLKRSATGEFIERDLTFHDVSDTERLASRFIRLIGLFRILLFQSRSGKTTTMRDIYYRDVQLFGGRQENLNRSLYSLTQSLNLLTHSHFKITITPKGTVWGVPSTNLQIGDDHFTLFPHMEALLIPIMSKAVPLKVEPEPDVVVVFEKDAIMKQFCSHKDLNGFNIIAVTGKGYPDRCTKAFLHSFCRAYPNIPVLVFVDSDVYGLEIFWQYAPLLIGLAPKFRLAGVFITEYTSGWLPLRDREWSLMISLLKRLNLGGEYLEPYEENVSLTRRELTRGLLLFKKAEMNVIHDSSDNVGLDVLSFLRGKILEIVGTGDFT